MKPKPFSALNHFTMPCVAMESFPCELSSHRPCQQTSAGTLLCDFGSGSWETTRQVSLGRTESPGHCPQGGSGKERRPYRCRRVRAATSRPKLTTKSYQTELTFSGQSETAEFPAFACGPHGGDTEVQVRPKPGPPPPIPSVGPVVR